MSKRKISLIFGPSAPKIEEQLRVQGWSLLRAEARAVEDLRLAITNLIGYGILMPFAGDVARKRLMKWITRRVTEI